ncbi:hypothetical protein M8C21_013948 [Ambrosia artemisiifolia]|uniref:Uncharacterized protein n=1 Tax=Ambrosia artemisiifolia TaxID=4212 RepID=A0AAD5BLU7_AMBAR|nr:hypothetical protein M8C21_013948 [Ambrosia artemisiifolia]
MTPPYTFEGVGKDTTGTTQDVGEASGKLADQITPVAPEDLKVNEESSSKDPGLMKNRVRLRVCDNAAEKNGIPTVDDKKYFEKDTLYKIKIMVVKYLRDIQHPRAELINGPKIHREKIDCATRNNVDRLHGR